MDIFNYLLIHFKSFCSLFDGLLNIFLFSPIRIFNLSNLGNFSHSIHSLSFGVSWLGDHSSSGWSFIISQLPWISPAALVHISPSVIFIAVSPLHLHLVIISKASNIVIKTISIKIYLLLLFVGGLTGILLLVASFSSRLVEWKSITVIILSPWLRELMPTYWKSFEKIFFLWPLLDTPSSIIRPIIVWRAWFLPLTLNSEPIFSPEDPYPCWQRRFMRSEKLIPFELLCPNIPVFYMSRAWSSAARESPLWSWKGGSGACFSRKAIASVQAPLPSFVL